MKNGVISRRDFLKYSSFAALAPALPAWGRPTNPDVIIVGAGAAGLSAARALAKLGRTFIVLEAADRIGGRVHTDMDTFGVPFDIGAHWLHNDALNPFQQYGINHGFTIYPDPINWSLYKDGDPAKVQDLIKWQNSYSSRYQAILGAGAAGLDVSPASVVPDVNEWDAGTALLLGAISMGKDLSDYSTLDWYNSAGGEDWFCGEGYGALVADFAKDIPVELNTPVDRIVWGLNGVTVNTSRGTLQAQAVIVTTSLGVLSSGKILFDPALPDELQTALGNMPMGVYNHVALHFSDDVLGHSTDHYLDYDPDSLEAFGFLANIAGNRLTYAENGGNFARDLEHVVPDVAVDLALEQLVKIFGSNVRSSFVKGEVTRWGQNPNTLGSWASTVPGEYDARGAVRKHSTVGGRLFLAGEALHPYLWATVAGAALSGKHTAHQVDVVLDGGEYQPMESDALTSDSTVSRGRISPFARAAASQNTA